MSEMRVFSDEELTAYLDGEGDDALRAEIDAQLEQDNELGQRLAALDIPIPAIGAAFDGLLAEAPQMPDLPEPAVHVAPANTVSTPRWRGFVPGAGIGLAAGLAVAMFTGLGQKPAAPKEPGWLEVVANYQMLYVPRTLEKHYGTPSLSARVKNLNNLSKVVGVDLSGLATIEGLSFRRAQELGFRGKPLIQIAYTLADGTPVAICLLESGNDAKPPSGKTISGLAAANWTTGKHGILIIGGQDQAVIDDLAAKVQPLI